MSKRALRPVKKRPVPRRRSQPPHRRTAAHRKRPHRRFRLGAYVARKVEEHARLGRESMRIALTLAIAVLFFMVAHAVYRAWNDLPPLSSSVDATDR